MAVLIPERAMAQQPLHPFFTGQHREVHVVVPSRQQISNDHEQSDDDVNTLGEHTVPSMDEDPNYDRRKRQRTLSPTRKEIENASKSTLKNRDPPESAAINGAVQEGGTITEADIITTQVEGRSTDLQPVVQLDGSNDEPEDDVSGTPQKRLLRLRPDGKLKSPGSTEQKEETRGRRKRRSGKKGKQCTIKYGRTPHERLAIGKKLEQIASGKLRVRPRPQKETEPPKEDETRVLKASDNQPPRVTSSRATHPFFLGTQKRDRSSAAATREKTEQAHAKSQPSAEPPARLRNPGWSSSFGSSFAKPVKIPGSKPPIWPPSGMQHIRGLEHAHACSDAIIGVDSTRVKKHKGKEGYIPAGQEIYASQKQLVHDIKHNDTVTVSDRTTQGKIRVPRRILLTGTELQAKVWERLQYHIIHPQSVLEPVETTTLRDQPDTVVAVQRLFSRIVSSSSVFDTFDGDTQDWCHKFAPKCTQDLLQDQAEVGLLKQWIQAMNVDHVDTGAKAAGGKTKDVRKQLAAKRRKRKAKEELDDFIVSSDEDTGKADDLTETEDAGLGMDPESSSHRTTTLKKLKPASFGKTRAVVISGPTGCGKTAAVYAIAAELGFEVFEINAGTRRNGRDIMDRVGNMTQNHLVGHGGGDAGKIFDSAALPTSSDPPVHERLKDVASFFKAAPPVTSALKSAAIKKKATTDVSDGPAHKTRKQQKQSLILLEDVDILFEEDRPFWSAVFALVVQSRRPIIMTCSDERCLPLEDFVDTALLRLSSPSPSAIAGYCLCIAAHEGHLLDLQAVRNLVALRRGDLRGAINDLQFWCQMAVGDDKYGIAWFLEAKAANKKRAPDAPKLRIVSEGTLEPSCFLFDRKQGRPRDREYQSRLLMEAYAYDQYDPLEIDAASPPAQTPFSNSDSSMLDRLRTVDQYYDALSAADTFALCPTDQDRLDITLPDLTEKSRADFPDSFPLLHADLREACTDLGFSMAISIRASVQDMLYGHLPTNRKSMAAAVLRHLPTALTVRSRSASLARTAFTPLTEVDDGNPWNPSQGPGLSTLHGPSRMVAAEVAPAIRSIALFDTELAKERTRLNDALNEPGRNSKRQRRTRAARAALEGGSKASTRREKWWSKSVDYGSILKTGGAELNRVGQKSLQAARAKNREDEILHDMLAEESNSTSQGESMAESNDELMA